MATFRLLHASDLHFYRTERVVGLPDSLRDGSFSLKDPWRVSSYDRHLAEALAQFAFVNRLGIDAIVLTGDLASTGDLTDLAIAGRFIEASPVDGAYYDGEGFPTLRAAGKRVFLMPGNHDRFGPTFEWSSVTVYPPGNTEFDNAFSAYWGANQGAQLLWSGTDGAAAAHLIAADLSLAPDADGGEPVFGHFGRGEVREALMGRLTDLTVQARQATPHAAILWAIHFDPTSTDGSLLLNDPQGLLQTAVTSAKPDAILCGHTHLKSATKAFNSCPVLLSGTTTQWYAADGNYLQVIEIEVDPSGHTPPQIKRIPFVYELRGSQYGFFAADD